MSSERDTRYDDTFAEMASRLGGLTPMMEAFFGFLARRTDFYIVSDPSAPAPMGFPPGVASKILLDSMGKYCFQNYTDTDHYRNSKSSADSAPHTGVSAASKSKGVTNQSRQKASGTNASAPAAAPPKVLDSSAPQDPIGNGGFGPGYYWTQTLKEVTLYVDLEQDTKKSDICCVIEAKHASISIKRAEVVHGEFEDVIRRSESIWTLASGAGDNEAPQLVLSLEKTRETWWKSFFVGHPEIDTTKVDSTQRIDEYDEETQATIRKLMYEQQQKRRLERNQECHPSLIALNKSTVEREFAPPREGPFL